MTDKIAIEDYLAQGGMLSSPANVPSRYRGELLRVMASFVDSSLAGSAGFATTINDAPGIQERISAARIVLEKADHASRVLNVMETFGANAERYAVNHPWSARMARDTDLGQARQAIDMRLSVFHYPLDGWVDAVVMNVLMGKASVIQIDELARMSYQPLADVLRAIVPRERRHAELGLAGLVQIVDRSDTLARAKASVQYWYPRVAASFGQSSSERFETLARLRIRHTPNEALLAKWRDEVDGQLCALRLN